MRWSQVREALAARYGAVTGPYRRNMADFARRAGLNKQTVRRILLSEHTSEAPIEWDTIAAWLRVTGGGTVTEFLEPYEAPRKEREASRHPRRAFTSIPTRSTHDQEADDLDIEILQAFSAAQYRALVAIFKSAAIRASDAEKAATPLPAPRRREARRSARIAR